jgi:2-polyprenyl-3-methyl-5-hydroxy-6-metoxy-1,4-benzoquinol methylase
VAHAVTTGSVPVGPRAGDAHAAAAATIRRKARPDCPLCGSPGAVRHAVLIDRWFGIAGEWGMRACARGECGAWYLDPVPHPDDIPLLYRRYYTHDHDGVAWDALGKGLPRRARLAYLARVYGYRLKPSPPVWLGHLLALVPGRRENLDLSVLELRSEWRGPLLDVGCGVGVMVRLLRDLGWDAEGIDLDPAAVAVAQAGGLRVRVATLADAGLAERGFAAVTSSHVIEHVPEPELFLRQCLRVTRPGGRLALTTPNASSLGHRVFGARWRGLEPPRHLQVFTAASLARLARAAGYEDVRVKRSARLAAVIVRETLRPDVVGLATSHPAGVPVRLVASGFQMLERALLPFAREAGEELLLTARAPGAPR